MNCYISRKLMRTSSSLCFLPYCPLSFFPTGYLPEFSHNVLSHALFLVYTSVNIFFSSGERPSLSRNI